MQISDSLEVGIGLSFIFFLASLILTSIHEMIETIAKQRGANLYKGIVEMLSDPADLTKGEDAAKTLYQHPLIRGLMRGDIKQAGFDLKNLPSYLPSKSFVLSLIDQATQGKLAAADAVGARPPTALLPVQQLRMMAEGIDNDQVRGALLHAVEIAGDDISVVRDHLEQWFDGAMDRVSGWYKRRSQRIIFGLGLLMAVALNINTIVIADSLSKSETLRQAVLTQAQTLEKQCHIANACTHKDAVAELNKTSLPVGWDKTAQNALTRLVADDTPAEGDMKAANQPNYVLGGVVIVAGYLLTAFAVTLGAPFWFDVLNRLMVIRATVKPTEKSKDEASQDAQSSADGKITVSVEPSAAAQPISAGTPAQIDGAIYDVVPSGSDRQFEDDEGEPVIGAPPPEQPAPVQDSLAPAGDQ